MQQPTPKKTDRPRALLTVREVAELDHCSEKTVRRAIAAGLLEVVRVGPGGRLLRIDPAAHAAYRAVSRW
ncbi:helix-turn-helix domain-containing protein [Thioclava electrotropha]|uniref:Helix-turn-helix domain-containing protein n=1 Tax=Thioclava electrotropha TaxID=1549850 RepID=A0ABX6YPE4_9RHOB|nr:helix-turn-helix domain-containing protein [Thioclava electrotropha]QPZ89696.1 helix-turn-helix domain-containing protein [Thioclava electrotropha]